MSRGSLELSLSFYDHVAGLRVSPDDDGWDVCADVDGREIAHEHCADWRRVERFRLRMQGWLKSAGPDFVIEDRRPSAA